MNGDVQNRFRSSGGVQFSSSGSQSSLSDGLLRSHVLDDRGGVWNLLPSGLNGLGFVRVGVHGRNGAEAYAPTEIGRLLQLLDDLGRSYDDPADGFYANADSCGEGGCNTTYGSAGITSPKKFFPYSGNTFVSGSKSTFEHGQRGTVTMTFVPQAGNVNYTPKFFQFQGEIVVGIVQPNMKTSYTLQILNLERVNMPAY
jgi:hypothetical protein